ncbi:MAG: MaoC/PaaZ C-terminal domain-containing protein [Myxococcota bacterium]
MSQPAEKRFEDVEFGEDLPEVDVDVRLETGKVFAHATLNLAPRVTDHEAAKAAGLPGAIVPGIMSQGILVAAIHAWAPNARVLNVDTIFRAPLIVDSKPVAKGVVTDIDDETKVIEVDLTLQNEKGETPVVGTAKITL